MIFLVYPSDPSTHFLQQLLDQFSESIKVKKVCLIVCEASDMSYEEARRAMKETPEGSTIIFMGHGTPDKLYGGTNDNFSRKAFITIRDMPAFTNRTLIFMSCYSANFLKASRQIRNYNNSIGFGLLPSDLNEMQNKSQLNKLDFNESDINQFRQCLIEIFSELTNHLLTTNKSVEQVVDHIKLFINCKINSCILNEDNSKLANLLFYMNSEIHYD
jgi:hypothetical protein